MYENDKTPEIALQFQGFWSEWGDSNSRHLEPKQSDNLFSNLFDSV